MNVNTPPSAMRAAGAGHASVPPGLAVRADEAARIAAVWADDVDRDARFPAEAVAALRRTRLLGAMLPVHRGADGASVSDVISICYRLGQACASTAMIFAMHQSCVACLLRHGGAEPWQASLLRRLGTEQLLLASSTTEGQAGGDVRASLAAVTTRPDGIVLDRAASVISYGAQADAILTTARRHPDAAAADQVLVAFARADYVLEPAGGWDTLGMRGTCSAGFHLRARGQPAQVLPDPYADIHVQTLVPISQLAWSGAWAGIAAAAAERARGFTRTAMRRNAARLPPGAAHYTQARASLQTLRSLVAAAARSWELHADEPEVLRSFEFQSEMNILKVQASSLAVATVMQAAQACGLAGYRNDSPFSVGRHVRDVMSSPIMISNDRILGSLTQPLLLSDMAGLDMA